MAQKKKYPKRKTYFIRAGIFLGVSVAALPLAYLCYLADNTVMTILVFVLGFAALACIMSAYWNFRAGVRACCTKCGTHYDYEENIEWQVDTVETVPHKQDAGYDQVATVTVHAICPECGEERTYNLKCTTERCSAEGKITTKNLEKYLADYFKI